MSMELLGARHLAGTFYSPGEASRSYHHLLEEIIQILPWIAIVDAFQHWVYSNPNHSREERRAAWVSMHERFGGGVDWSGLAQERANLWHRQLHVFLYPFYYIEYGIAQLGALQIWRRAQRDRKGAVGAYRRALAIGGARPLPELFAAAEISFDFREGTLAPLMNEIREELKRVSA